MALLDDIGVSRTLVEDRSNQLAKNIMSSSGGYSWDNADKADSWDGRWLSADRERLRQLDLLSAAVTDPSWTDKLDKEVGARKDAGFKAADYGHRRGEDQRKTTAAAGGTAGGSWDAVVQAQNAQELANTKAKVSQQVAELKAAGLQNLEEMGRQLLSKALAGPDEGSAMGVQTAGDENSAGVRQMQAQNDGQYSRLMADTLGSFLSDTVSPAISSGFQAADNWNQDMRDNYRDARDSGTNTTFANWEAANGGSRSWWGF